MMSSSFPLVLIQFIAVYLELLSLAARLHFLPTVLLRILLTINNNIVSPRSVEDKVLAKHLNITNNDFLYGPCSR